jgi:hypothetical protein
MHSASSSEDMNDDSGNSAFGNSLQAQQRFGSGSQNAPFGGGSLSPVQEDGRMSQSTSPVPQHSNMSSSGDDLRLKAKLDEKKRLEAQLEEKKKKLLASKLKKSQAAKKSSGLNASATPFVPGGGFSPATTPPPDEASSNTNLAERNAQRFSAQNQDNAVRSMLPSDLKARAENEDNDVGNTYVTASDKNRADLGTAKSLVGTCKYMCPDDELLRREREGDIQQLEIPQPGTLHPAHWTLRDTAVKRFRRSAADYKLDVVSVAHTTGFKH